MGYHRAGFDVVGVDIKPQPRYPFEFHQQDALEVLENPWHVGGFHAIHASPPCERYCALTRASGTADRHPDHLAKVRMLLRAWALPYVIENVPEAPMEDAILFCGAALGLEIVRHRLFEANWPLMSAGCAHVRGGTTTGLYVAFRPRGRVAPGRKVPPRRGRQLWREAVGIDWMTETEIADAIPPAYTQEIGRQLLIAQVRNVA